jgi:hypothetical protein
MAKMQAIQDLCGVLLDEILRDWDAFLVYYDPFSECFFHRKELDSSLALALNVKILITSK